ncbi:MAG: hypothetical protein RIS35_1440, partial [Pseudomonadota bacterium]
ERISSIGDPEGVRLVDATTGTSFPIGVTIDADGNLLIEPVTALSYGRSYFVTWGPGVLFDLAGNPVDVPDAPDIYRFQTEDGDGVPTATESEVPSLQIPGAVQGDGNGDGVADAGQQAVASVAFRETSKISVNPDAPRTFVTLVAGSEEGKSDDSGSTLIDVRQLDAPVDLPDEMDAPLGLISFKALIAEPGASESFSLYVDPDLGISGYWKANPSGQWVNLASEPFGGAVTDEGGMLRMDFVIRDGGPFDADGLADGVISDPGAIAYLPPSIIDYPPVLLDGVPWFWF